MKKKTAAPTGATDLGLQVEQQLLNASAFLQGVQDSLSAQIAILNKNGVIVQVNTAWRRFGESNGLQTSAHCLGVNYLELCDSASGENSEEAGLTARAIRNVLAGVQQEDRIEYPCDGPDEKRWFLLKVTKFENEGNVWVVLAHENITERKQIMESLSASEARYRLLANNVPDIVYSLDGEGKIVTVNSPAFERYGYTEQNSKGKPFLTFIHPEDREIVNQSFLTAMQEQRKFTHGLQFRIVAENGSSYWLELNSQAHFDSQGRYMGEDGVLRDISEHKLAEDVLRESQERFKAIANFGVSWESWFGPDGKYLWVNPGVEHFTGYSAQEILAMPDFISTIIADEDRSMFINRFQGAISGNRGENFEFRYLHKNGARRWLSVSWQPIYDAQGNQLGTRSSGYDITERKQAEEALLKKMDELERFQRITVGREVRMIGLKKEVNHLLQQTGQPEKYRIVDEK